MKVKHVHYTDVKADAVEEEGARGAKVRWLIRKEDGAPLFAMRVIEVDKEGFTPWHVHDWEHEVFVLTGKGTLVTDEEKREFKEGDVIFVSPGERHQFRNSGEGRLKFLCMVPHTD